MSDAPPPQTALLASPGPPPGPVAAPEPPPPAERSRQTRELWLSLVLAAVLGALLLLPPIAGLTQGVGDSGLFLILNAATLAAILLLGFLITRNFWRLVGERRRGILGSNLDLKFAAAFVLIVVVTAAGLYGVSAFLITQSIDKWFSARLDAALQESGELAESYYLLTAQSALRDGDRLAATIARDGLLAPDAGEALARLVGEKQRELHLGVVEVFAVDGAELVSAINPEIPAMNFSRPGSELVRAGLQGEPTWRAEEVGSGDVIRAVVPIVDPSRPGQRLGAVVVNSFIPFAQARKVASVRAILDDYRALQPTAGHIRSAYLLELLLAFLVILMFAAWLGFRLARGVTGPIRALAEGTEEVARGNLDIVVERSSDDELGFLVQSFNRMTHDLRDARTRVERSNAEALRRRRYMEAVVGTIGAGVMSLDADGRIHTINPSARRYLGISATAEVVGQKVAEVARAPQLLETLEALGRRLRPGVRDSVRRQVRVDAGDDVATLLVTLQVLSGEASERAGTVVVFDDYTQLVKVQRMEAWREVARRIAHEIKNPLTPIQLSAQRIRRRFGERLAGDPDDARVLDECLAAIVNHVASLERLVDEFSNFARLPNADPRPDDLNRIVADTVASYDGTEGVCFETELDGDLPMVDLDRDQIRRVLGNLIDNAIAAVREREAASPAPRTGRVRLRTAHDPALHSVKLEVCDDGVGVSHEDRRRIFEPYYSTKRKGTGLGLAIVSRIVADHRGYVRVDDASPNGTRFVVELPVRGA